MKRILALDLSLTRTGVCRLYGDTTTTGSLRAPTKIAAGIERLVWFADVLDEIARRERPDIVAIEGYAIRAKFRPYARAELGGVARVAFARVRSTILLVPPKTAKGFVTGNGNAEKDEVLAAVGPLLGLDAIKNTDEGDAAAIAYFAKKWLTPSSLSHKQHAALAKCEVWRPEPIVYRSRAR